MSDYDTTPYASKLNRARHIDGIGTMAKLYGYEPTSPFAARVLEIGCACGDALFPLALEYPQASFIGVDPSAQQVSKANERLRQLNESIKSEITFICGDIQNDALKGKKFDYIICHGVLSWIKEEERQLIISTLPSLLASNGVCFLSYNCAPGAEIRKTTWDAIKKISLTAGADIAKVRKLLTYFHDAIEIDHEKPYQMFLFHELHRILKESDNYLVHEVLARENNPFDYKEVSSSLSQVGLKIIGDVRPHRTGLQRFLSAHLPESGYEALSKLQTEFGLQAETIVDFCFGTPFRESLVMHEDAKGAAHLSRELFHTLSFSHTGATTDESSSTVEKILLTNFPQFLTFSDLTTTEMLAQIGGDTDFVSSQLMKSFVQDRVITSFYPPEIAQRVLAFPQTSTWIRYQAEQQSIVTNLQYRSIELDSLALALLAKLDGKTGREELETLAHRMIKSGEGGIRQNGEVVTDPIIIATLIPDIVEGALETLKKAAMLLP